MRSALEIAKNMSVRHNVTFNVYDEITGRLLQHHEGHNAATNSIITGIAHYLVGEGVLNQGYDMLSSWVPKYISLGTMGLYSQDVDASGLPSGIGYSPEASEEQNFIDYMQKCPGYGADGYDQSLNNDRDFLGIGRMFKDRPTNGRYNHVYMSDGRTQVFEVDHFIRSIISVSANLVDITAHATFSGKKITLDYAPAANVTIVFSYLTTEESSYRTVKCELISDTFPRIPISYRSIVPEHHAEIPRTVDVVFSAMVSTGALKQFRDPGKDYVLVTEAGLWSRKTWPVDANGHADYTSGDNGLLAGYRIGPADYKMQDMTKAENREALKTQILRIGYNQVVQVIWKIQLGSIDEFGGWEPDRIGNDG